MQAMLIACTMAQIGGKTQPSRGYLDARRDLRRRRFQRCANAAARADRRPWETGAAGFIHFATSGDGWPAPPFTILKISCARTRCKNTMSGLAAANSRTACLVIESFLTNRDHDRMIYGQ